MASAYPAALDNLSANKTDNTAAAGDHAPHHNALADAVNAVQTALGANLANVVAASDPRLTDSRTPTTHKTTHATGGTDVLTPADIGAEVSGAASTAVAAHVAAADPHPNYTTTVEAAAAAPVQSVAGRTGAVTLAKADVGLGNVDNTSDASKPVSTATQTALNGKANSVHTHVAADVTDFVAAAAAAAPVQSVAGRTGAVTLSKTDVSLGNVDNTSDANKPVSSATQTALDGKAATVHTHVASDVTDFSTAADSRIAASNKVSSNISGITGADQVTNMVSLTQAEYDALGTKNASTFYLIAG